MRHVRWTEVAAADLTHICDYNEEHVGPDAARRTALRILEAIGQLSRFPESGRTGRKPGTREFVVTGLPFLAVYRLREDVVEVVRILHGARRWP